MIRDIESPKQATSSVTSRLFLYLVARLRSKLPVIAQHIARKAGPHKHSVLLVRPRQPHLQGGVIILRRLVAVSASTHVVKLPVLRGTTESRARSRDVAAIRSPRLAGVNVARALYLAVR